MRGLLNNHFWKTAALALTGLTVYGLAHMASGPAADQDTTDSELKVALASADCTRPLNGQTLHSYKSDPNAWAASRYFGDDVTIKGAKPLPAVKVALPNTSAIELTGVTKSGREITAILHWNSSICGSFDPEFMQKPAMQRATPRPQANAG
jgi:hypothetical protein